MPRNDSHRPTRQGAGHQSTTINDLKQRMTALEGEMALLQAAMLLLTRRCELLERIDARLQDLCLSLDQRAEHPSAEDPQLSQSSRDRRRTRTH